MDKSHNHMLVNQLKDVPGPWDMEINSLQAQVAIRKYVTKTVLNYLNAYFDRTAIRLLIWIFNVFQVMDRQSKSRIRI